MRCIRSGSVVSTLTVFALTFLVAAGAGAPSASAQGVGDLPPGYAHFQRGDANGDGTLDLADPVRVLGYLFNGQVMKCLDAGDFNDDDALDLADVVASLVYQFAQGAPAPDPWSACGADPTLGFRLSCNSYGPCADETDVDTAAHVMRRLGYGPTPAGLQHVMDIGYSAYIDEQLAPELIDETGAFPLEALMGLYDPTLAVENVLYIQSIRAVYSERQLQEALTDFWENHFNTYVLKLVQVLQQVTGDPVEAATTAVAWEWEENQFFRANALGSFHDLLLQSATGKAMTVYLDSYLNVAAAPNENYARELLELHTMGDDNGYTQQDIEELARVLTGWTLCKRDPVNVGNPHAPCVPFTDPNGVWDFYFKAPDHDYGAKTLFPLTVNEIVIPAGDPVVAPDAGLDEGLLVLDHLAQATPQVAEFISTKLIQKFVSEDVPPALLAQCIGVWLTTQGNIKSVMSTILHSPEFIAQENRWNKVTTPLEHHCAFIRALDGLSTTLPVYGGIGDPNNGIIGLDHVPFLFITPDGQPEAAIDWVGTTALLLRTTYVNYGIHNGVDPLFDPILMMTDAGIDQNSLEEVTDFWLQVAFQNSFNDTERTLALQYLSQGPDGTPAPFGLAFPDHEFRVRSLIGFIFSAPQFQKQ